MATAAVIGCGDVSVVHLAAIERLGVELVGVCDPEPGRAPTGYVNHRDLLDDLRPDVVHICTPHDQHVPIAIDALERGVHVLLEKPVAHTVAQAERLIAAAKDHPEVKIGVCLQNRYNLTAQAARTLLASGELGAVRGGSATVLWHRDREYYRARPWRGRTARSGGGVLINQAIHTLDLMEWLLGDVVEVRGHTGRYGFGGEIDVEDTAHLLLEHAGGARSVLFATVTNVHDAPVGIEIVTERATLLIRGDLTVSYRDGRTEVLAERRTGPGGRAYWGASHELLIADFYRQLPEPAPFWLGVEEGTRSLRLIDQVYRQHT
ncbi:Gfo/Idh/MocA family protein [Micromonospora sp. NPDC051006]|uniref:Gfo/Idh/MocA family protein n=1 Tax=Micromonospora sp. NPDC051006 TaxID=3364283 RepID=UPI0037B80190